MKDAQKPDQISLNILVVRLKEGQFVITAYQPSLEIFEPDYRTKRKS